MSQRDIPTILVSAFFKEAQYTAGLSGRLFFYFIDQPLPELLYLLNIFLLRKKYKSRLPPMLNAEAAVY